MNPITQRMAEKPFKLEEKAGAAESARRKQRMLDMVRTEFGQGENDHFVLIFIDENPITNHKLVSDEVVL
ncbi:MAG: hypothetical protein L7S63_00605 [Flavobacteriales bacterium]|nr:hypothetical protein [Flavobacteriales bacterium]